MTSFNSSGPYLCWAKSKSDTQFQQGVNTWVWVGPPSSQVRESSLVPFGQQPPLCLCPPQVPGWNRWPRCRLSQTLNEFSAKNMYIYIHICLERGIDGETLSCSDTLLGDILLHQIYCLVFYQHITSPGFLLIRYHLGFSFTLQRWDHFVVSSLTLWCLAPESYISPLLYVLRWPALLLCLPISLILFLDSLYSWPLCHHLLPPPSPTATCNLSELQSSPLCSYRRDSKVYVMTEYYDIRKCKNKQTNLFFFEEIKVFL